MAKRLHPNAIESPLQRYGTWPSSISAELLGQAGDVWTRFDRPEPRADGTYWLESRPGEGRTVLVKKPLVGPARDVTPPGFDVRSNVHEYGGGAYFLDGAAVFFSSAADGRVYRHEPGGDPVAVTPEPEGHETLRYAEGLVVPGAELAVCVRERHSTSGVENELVAFPVDGSAAPRPLVSDHDFVSFPCASPDGTRLAWTTWELPGMPFHGTDLWVADLHPNGVLGAPQHVAGGRDESIFQPQWSPAGELYYVSDRSGWWNLYRLCRDRHEPVGPVAAELGWPQWFCGLSSYAFLDDGRIACLVNWGTEQGLALIEPDRGVLERQELFYTAVCYPHLRAYGTRVVFIAASALETPAVVSWDAAGGRHEVLARSAEPVDPVHIAKPRPLTIPSRDGALGRATFFEPTNPGVTAPADEKPPLVVLAHGGPTDQAPPGLRLDIQFFTSRGIAVLDVDYAGSTGYGRRYADRLQGGWGIADVHDCVAAANHLASLGLVDRKRMAIVGGSAGGYVVLSALAFHDVFAAGVSFYGIADLETFATGTHKFESGYVEWLVGPAAEAALYAQRSPVRSAAAISAPLLLIHGLDDHVVPPDQSEILALELEQNGVHYEFLGLPGEGHGFRHAASLERAYGRLLKFLLAAFAVAEG